MNKPAGNIVDALYHKL